jgi:hypothetical protein
MTKITKYELNQMIKEEVRRQTSRNRRRRLFENNEKDFEIDGTTLIRYKGNDSDVTIPDGITEIDMHAFRGCKNLKSITIPNSVEEIDKKAFMSCKSLTSITIPNSVTSIGWNAFYSCGLTSITIPNSVTNIDEGAFKNCKNLISIQIPERFKDEKKLDIIGFNKYQRDLILKK